MTRGPFLERPGNYWTRKAVLFSMKIEVSKVLQIIVNTIKLSVCKTKWKTGPWIEKEMQQIKKRLNFQALSPFPMSKLTNR